MDVKADKLVKAYVKIRDKRRELASEFEKQDAELQESLDMIERHLLDLFKETGVESLRTEFGTVSRRVAKRYWTNDWHSFYEFLKAHGAVELLEKRIAQTNMSVFLEENPELLPPGLQIDKRYAVTVTRKRS
jgi:hypothetical protein